MKKVIIIFSLLFLATLGVTSAQEQPPTPTKIQSTVAYDLAYPGMLPNSPFYKIKVLRDKVVLTLKRDPIKKVEYHLILADKRIHMAKILAEKNEIELAKETVLKGENEYTLLVNILKNERKKPPKELYEKLEKASLKHQEILAEIASKQNGENKKLFETVIYFSKINLGELKNNYHDY